MRLAFFVLQVALLSACSVVPPQAWTFDPSQPRAALSLPPAEALALTQRVAQLQLQRTEIRSRIAAEPDVWKRQQHYAQLHTVGRQLSPLERRLAEAGAR